MKTLGILLSLSACFGVCKSAFAFSWKSKPTLGPDYEEFWKGRGRHCYNDPQIRFKGSRFDEMILRYDVLSHDSTCESPIPSERQTPTALELIALSIGPHSDPPAEILWNSTFQNATITRFTFWNFTNLTFVNHKSFAGSRLPIKYFNLSDSREPPTGVPEIFAHGFQHVDELVLERIGLKSIAPDVFSKMPLLAFLTLAGNAIETLPNELFQKSVRLLNLNLANNRIKQIPPNFLGHSPKLDSLNLQGNQIDDLTDALNRNFLLRDIHLENNSFTNVDPNWFFGQQGFQKTDYGTLYLYSSVQPSLERLEHCMWKYPQFIRPPNSSASIELIGLEDIPCYVVRQYHLTCVNEKKWGLFCNRTCNCALDDLCDRDTGICEYACATGYLPGFGDTCQQTCDTIERWGDCNRKCHCRDGEACHHISGACPGACEPGLYPGYGEPCYLDCVHLNCAPNTTCNDTGNVCDGDCQPGHFGGFGKPCKRCSTTWNCHKDSECDEAGNCHGKCYLGFFGGNGAPCHHCSSQFCSPATTCGLQGVCDAECLDGFSGGYGSRCYRPISDEELFDKKAAYGAITVIIFVVSGTLLLYVRHLIKPATVPWGDDDDEFTYEYTDDESSSLEDSIMEKTGF